MLLPQQIRFTQLPVNPHKVAVIIQLITTLLSISDLLTNGFEALLNVFQFFWVNALLTQLALEGNLQLMHLLLDFTAFSADIFLMLIDLITQYLHSLLPVGLIL